MESAYSRVNDYQTDVEVRTYGYRFEKEAEVTAICDINEKHLDDVVDVLKRFGYSGKYIIAGYLHDILEDTGLSYNDVKRHFDEEIAEMVTGKLVEYKTKEYSSISRSLKSLERQGLVRRVQVKMTSHNSTII
jgi:GTP pyrophosphokinase